MDDFFEGYNLSYKIEDPLDWSSDYQMQNTLQVVNEYVFGKEEVRDIIDIAVSENTEEEVNVLRLGVRVYQQQSIYQITILQADEKNPPTTQDYLEIKTDANQTCTSVTYLNPTVALLYCSRYASYDSKTKLYTFK
jgi:hypothetical protein